MMPQDISRRRFLGQVNCAAISSLPILSTLLNLKLAGDAAAATSGTQDYKALVCLFMGGGMDTYNVLVPRGKSEYAEYAGARGAVALPQANLLPISPIGLSGMQLGVHPGFANVQSLFEAGQAAFVANVGTLTEPLTKVQYNGTARHLPLGLYSHSDQQEQWQTSTPNARSSKGWAGKAADLLAGMNSQNKVSMNVSLSGQNIWQSGANAFAYTVNTGGAVALDGYNSASTNATSPVTLRTKAVDSQLALNYQNLIAQGFNHSKGKAMEAFALFNTATGQTLPNEAAYPNTNLARQLMRVAKTIAGRGTLGHNRQTFFIEYGGWDHHDNLISSQARMIPEVDAAIKAFVDSLTALGMFNNVTLFTASDFARTLTTDSSGTDHAWGGNHFVVGGAVKGRKVYGNYPSLAVGGALDVGRGRIIPQIAVDSYFAEMALWLGVSRADLKLLLPNIGTFYAANSPSAPLGFLV
ncbi:MAG: DUF1501 domain-containing protein [Verrucomicrobiota bacterium]